MNTRIKILAEIFRGFVDESLQNEKLDAYEATITIEVATAMNVLCILSNKFEDIIELFNDDIQSQTALNTWYNNQYLNIESLKENKEKEGK